MEKLSFDTDNLLESCIERYVETMVSARIGKEIENKVKEYEQELLSRRDEYIAEVMKGIRIEHEKRLGEINYRITFVNECVIKNA